jgi:putative FmdB family regulatory protein
MPTYEYRCGTCEHDWEVEQSIKDDALTECPRCKNATAKRQISRGTGFILKGGGWYSDLYASPSGPKAAEPSAASPATSSETKPSDAAPSGASAGAGSSGSGSSGSSTPTPSST